MPVQSSPVQSSPVQSSPVQSSPVQSSPVQSVIIPTYNRRDFLPDAINSVLSQTQKSLEVLVIDDCSTDGTEDFVKSIPDERVHYFRNEKNSGQEYSRMIGLRHAKGKYITFLDDDDYYTDYDFFTKAINIFTEHENDAVPIVMVYANAELVNTMTHDSAIWNIGSPGRFKGLDYVLGKGHTKPPSTFPAVFSADALRRAGLEDNVIFDGLTYVQAALLGDGWMLPGMIGVYRVQPESAERGYKTTTPEREARHWRGVREWIRRKRLVRDDVAPRIGTREADRLYISGVLGSIGYCGVARPKIADRIRAVVFTLSAAGFMPKLWIRLPFWFLERHLRKITPLRKLYRFIKYRLRGRPYPEA